MITATILTKNSEETLASCLKALEPFDEVVILDTGSIDLTLDIAETFPNVKIYRHDFIGFGPLHNLASQKASHDWILSLDSDEVLSEELAKEILTTHLDPNSVYSFPFQNFFKGKLIRGCGWHPDRHVRLYHRQKTRFSNDYVHEKICTDALKEVPLIYPVKHYSYRSISDFLKKMENYTTLFAEQNKGKIPSSFSKALFHSIFAFFKSYFLKRGFLDGKEGFIISLYNSQTAFYKYLKLHELSETNAAVTSLSSRRAR